MKRIVIDVKDDIHRQVKLIAFSHGMTMNEMMQKMLKDFLKDKVYVVKDDGGNK